MRKQISLTSNCPMNFAKFPFDQQTCVLNASTYSQSGDETNLQPDPKGVLDLSSYNTKFSTGPFTFSATSTTKTQSIKGYDFVSGTITFKRDEKFFWFYVFVPDIILHIAVWTNFFIQAAAAPARVTICVIATLSFRFMMCVGKFQTSRCSGQGKSFASTDCCGLYKKIAFALVQVGA